MTGLSAPDRRTTTRTHTSISPPPMMMADVLSRPGDKWALFSPHLFGCLCLVGAASPRMMDEPWLPSGVVETSGCLNSYLPVMQKNNPSGQTWRELDLSKIAPVFFKSTFPTLGFPNYIQFSSHNSNIKNAP